MKKLTTLFLAILICFTSQVKADEGMWLLPLIQKLNLEKMQEMGLKLSAEEIYSINQSSLKDAVVIFGGGCTGELISDQGLLLTNHHCGYGAIQELSSVEHNYLEDGFWARSLEEEIPAPGISVTFLKRMEDVTAQVLAGIEEDMTEAERRKTIMKTSNAIADSVAGDSHYKTLVKDYFEGNQYFLIVYEVFNDVRFVGAPPSSIGKFGFDTDNWMWPRHTGDFSMFRVYAAPDGKPASYAPENKPLKPVHHLPISLKGYEKEDFAMTIGYPGSTNRYLTSWGIKERMEIFNYSLINPRGVKQNIWKEAMMSNDKIKLQYSSKFARSSNYWKNSIGMNRGIENLQVIEHKRALEAQFQKWINADPLRKEKYAAVLPGLKDAYTGRATNYMALNFIRECMLRGTEIIMFATKARQLENALSGSDATAVESAVKNLKQESETFFKNYHAPTDQKVMAALFKLYSEEIEPCHYPSFFKEIKSIGKPDAFDHYATKVFQKSIFVNQNTLEDFLAHPKHKKLQKDPIYNMALSTMKKYRDLYDANHENDKAIRHYNRLFISGLMEMDANRVFYPDANFTMRLSFGSVGDYEPRDAVIYSHFTTLKGVMEKEDPDNFEFVVPAKLKTLFQEKDFGSYADSDGKMHVCFTTNNDITGGNSGSPVINGKGELFGLAFDGNWEAMSGDITFEDQLQKCINVDIRYVLFIIDKYAGAQNLIDEMTLVN